MSILPLRVEDRLGDSSRLLKVKGLVAKAKQLFSTDFVGEHSTYTVSQVGDERIRQHASDGPWMITKFNPKKTHQT